MSDFSHSILTLENQINELKAVVNNGAAIRMLKENSQFQTVVLEGYLNNESIRLVTLVSHPNLSAEQRADVQNQIIGIGAFRRFMDVQLTLAGNAERAIQQAEEELLELRQMKDAGIELPESDMGYNNNLGS